ncbi:hypothetical protein [Neptunicella marina]|uniref:hypothetical protein n=1 Tax=Neptunicella marina TaxID=2125989 RepID=UPI0030CA4EA8
MDTDVQDKSIQRRIDMDLLSRSSAGIAIYAIVLPAVFWPFDFYILQPELSLLFAGGMFFISALRYLHKLLTKPLYNYSPRLWLAVFSFLSLSHAAILSSIFTMAIYVYTYYSCHVFGNGGDCQWGINGTHTQN